jgi:hypothetical protein
MSIVELSRDIAISKEPGLVGFCRGAGPAGASPSPSWNEQRALQVQVHRQRLCAHPLILRARFSRSSGLSLQTVAGGSRGSLPVMAAACSVVTISVASHQASSRRASRTRSGWTLAVTPIGASAFLRPPARLSGAWAIASGFG